MTRKYRNQPTRVNGIRFDSKREAKRWSELLLLEMAGRIANLRRQIRFRLNVLGVEVCQYVADFVYIEAGQMIVEDVKGFRTPVYRLKAKLMKAIHGIEIREV